ncbi:RNA-binding protein 4F [Drosophila eugracilis]|uniref:RNA-binding protein 4F n=1 Tax=Drosophila eugracilis TaxID=29029 RepID=UPI0007E6CB1B|nr:RNA-binding protein 4F [Drosophila eugracilis]
MDDDKQLEKELDEMPVQDLDDDTYDEYDLIVIPDQNKASPKEDEVEEVEDEEEEVDDIDLPKRDERIRQPWPSSSAGEDMTTIELISSDDEPSVEEGAGNDSSSSSDDVGVIEDSDSELSSDNDGPGGNQLERSYEDLIALPNKQFAQLVSISEIAFKLNDLEKIESSVLSLQKVATVPAHIWLKYLKARLVVTQTPDERKEFEDKCAKALSYYYNIPLSEFIVGYLVDQGNVDNHILWAKLLADYDIERPDFGEKLRPLLSTISDEKESKAFEELLQKHCVSWKCSQEQRQIIKPIVDDFKRHLDEMKTQHNDWDWSKIHQSHIAEVQTLSFDDDLKNAVIRFIFERTVAKFPIADILWLSYIKFIQGEGGNAEEEDEENAELAAKRASRLSKGFLCSTALDLAKRGVRSRPSVRLNHRFLDLMERADYEQPEVDQQIRTILQRIVPDMTMTVELHLDYLAYRVRNTNAGDEEQATSLRAAFNRVWEELSALYGDEADTRYEVLQLWAQVEYTHLASPANGSHIWRQIMGYPGSSHRGLLWLGFAQMESEYNAGQGTRDVLREALSQPSLEDGIMVQELYRRYERCYGTYESIAACQALELPTEYIKLRPRMKPNSQQANSRQQQPRQHQPRQQQQQNREPLNREQRRRLAHEQQQGTKRPPPKLASKAELPDVPPSQSKVRLTGQSAAETRESNFKYSPHLEINKIFVRNLHPACSKEELQELFSPFGNIKDVRLVHKLNKQFKGIAYVEFELPGEAQRAVAGRDGYLLKGMNISVAISNPPPRGSSSDIPKPSVAPKRRVPTSLIPTTLVRQEVAAKKRRLLQVTTDRDGVEPTTSTSAGADDSTEPEANGKSVEKKEEQPATAPKSNDDFRKLFLKD